MISSFEELIVESAAFEHNGKHRYRGPKPPFFMKSLIAINSIFMFWTVCSRWTAIREERGLCSAWKGILFSMAASWGCIRMNKAER